MLICNWFKLSIAISNETQGYTAHLTEMEIHIGVFFAETIENCLELVNLSLQAREDLEKRRITNNG